MLLYLLDESPETTSRSIFELSVVPATSTPADSAKMLAVDLVRASLSYENTLEQVNCFCEKLEKLSK